MANIKEIAAELYSAIPNAQEKYGQIETVTLYGSHMYGLSTPDSDFDILILTDGKGKGYSNTGLNDDLRVDTIMSFIERLWADTPEDIDVLQSLKHSQLMNESKFAHYLIHFNFNAMKYSQNLQSHILEDLNRFERGKASEERLLKMLRIALRGQVILRKVQQYGNFFNPLFTESERESFYSAYEEFVKFSRTTNNARDLYIYSEDLVNCHFS